MTHERIIGLSGAGGFIGRIVRHRLTREPGAGVRPLTAADFTDAESLRAALRGVGAVVHLAARVRADDPASIYPVNMRLVETLIEAVKGLPAPPHLVFASSTQRGSDTPYGRAKRDSEAVLSRWAEETGGSVAVLELPNVFGPGARPHYNSVVATFAWSVAHGRQATVHEDRQLALVYVEDAASLLAQAALTPRPGVTRPRVQPVYHTTVSVLLERFERFSRAHAQGHVVPALETPLDVLLYATYQSYLGADGCRARPRAHGDARGVLANVVRWEGGGEVFFSTTRPGAVRGDHYHTRKLEKLCVMQGRGVIRLRRVGTSEVVEYRVSGACPEIVDVPVYHVHHVENVGDQDLLTLVWINEACDPSRPDTYEERV